jgi:hypothetical protein
LFSRVSGCVAPGQGWNPETGFRNPRTIGKGGSAWKNKRTKDFHQETHSSNSTDVFKPMKQETKAMKYFFLVLASVSLLMMTGCYGGYLAPVMPPQGWIYADIKAPIDTDANATVVSSKAGESESMSILGLVALGDASVRTAAANANISKIDHVDYSYFNVLFVYQRFTTRVYGE